MRRALTRSQRSYCMSCIRKKDTKPELAVRSIVHRLGYRFRIHRADLPGTPDVVLPKLKKIIFIHGCFWHLHSCRPGRIRPKHNAAYWETKRSRNAKRDRVNLRQLQRLGWDVIVIWECELRMPGAVRRRLRQFLSRAKPKARDKPRSAIRHIPLKEVKSDTFAFE